MKSGMPGSILKTASLVACVVMAGGMAACSADPLSVQQPIGAIELSSDYLPLVEGFRWAKQTALAYAYEGDPVGKWFEAALPGREAFCMRDASHQATGALALGLADHTKNMMRKFALGIAESRDWCSYWEIDRHDRPAPVDYRSDEDFWYNLPANFDVIQACYRIYEWTGDRDYLDDEAFLEFYRRSLNDYIETWDIDGDGLMESPAENGIRGIATYWEGGGPRAATGGDLVAAQYAANLAYSKVLALRGEAEQSETYGREADRLRGMYNSEWWAADFGRFYTSILEDGTFDTTHIPAMQIFPMYFGIVSPDRADRLFRDHKPGVNVEENSYLAEVYYEHGRIEAAFDFLMAQMDPTLERRDYPENPFTAVGGVVRYLAGVRPIASEAVVETRSRLPDAIGWVQLEHVTVLDNQIGVRHESDAETRFVNESGAAIRWRAVFPGEHGSLIVDGAPVDAQVRRTSYGSSESFVELVVDPGESRTVKVE